jgi:hypothetical protein
MHAESDGMPARGTPALLPNSDVLVVGGSTFVDIGGCLITGQVLTTAERYDVSTNTLKASAQLQVAYRTATASGLRTCRVRAAHVASLVPARISWSRGNPGGKDAAFATDHR